MRDLISENAKKIFVYAILLVAVIICVNSSPRFGYVISDYNDNFYILSDLTTADNSWAELTFDGNDGSQMMLQHNSRFFGDIILIKDGVEITEFNVGFDGTVQTTSEVDENTMSLLNNIAVSDSGSYFLWHFIKPILILISGLAVFLVSSKFTTKGFKAAAVTMGVLPTVIAFLVAFRLL